jgi:hypothetical protein
MCEHTHTHTHKHTSRCPFPPRPPFFLLWPAGLSVQTAGVSRRPSVQTPGRVKGQVLSLLLPWRWHLEKEVAVSKQSNWNSLSAPLSSPLLSLFCPSSDTLPWQTVSSQCPEAHFRGTSFLTQGKLCVTAMI